MKNLEKYCNSIIEEELKDKYKTKISLKVKNQPFNNANGFIETHFKDSTYEIIINKRRFTQYSEKSQLLYVYLTIFHKLEHIKTFEKNKEKGYFDTEHFISLLEYINYQYELNQPYNKINLNALKRMLLIH